MTNDLTISRELADKLAALENIKEDEPNRSGADFCPVCYGRGNWNWKSGSVIRIDPIEHDKDCALVELRALLAKSEITDHCKQCAEVVKTWPESKRDCLGKIEAHAVARQEPVAP